MEIKDIASFTGIEAKDFDEFKEKFNKSYVKRDIAATDDEIKTQIIGKFSGSALTALKRAAKAAGVTLEKDVVENKKLEEIIDYLGETFGKTIESTKGEYEQRIKATETDAVKEWKEKFEKSDMKNKDLSSALDATKNKIVEIETTSKNQIKSFRLNEVKKSAVEKIKWASTADDLKKKGFFAIIDESYELDLDEKDEPYVKDKKTGQRVTNPNKAGEFMSLEDVLLTEAEKNNLIQKNNANQNNPIFVQPGGGTQPVTPAANPVDNQRAVPASQRK